MSVSPASHRLYRRDIFHATKGPRRSSSTLQLTAAQRESLRDALETLAAKHAVCIIMILSIRLPQKLCALKASAAFLSTLERIIKYSIRYTHDMENKSLGSHASNT